MADSPADARRRTTKARGPTRHRHPPLQIGQAVAFSHRETESSCRSSPSPPGSHNLASVYPFELALPAEETGLRVDSEVQAKQPAPSPLSGSGNPSGSLVPTQLLEKLDDALRLHLQL